MFIIELLRVNGVLGFWGFGVLGLMPPSAQMSGFLEPARSFVSLIVNLLSGNLKLKFLLDI